MLFEKRFWLYLLLLVQYQVYTIMCYNSTFISTSFSPTLNPTQPSVQPTDVPSSDPTRGPTSIPTRTFYPTKAPFMNDGRIDYTTFEPIPGETDSQSDTQPCDVDHGCNFTSPTQTPSINPTNTPSYRPTLLPSQPSIEPTSSPTPDVQQSITNTQTSWNDPIVLAVGLLGFLVLVLTLMVTIFACMAYTKSKENMKITERLKAQFMADNSHSKSRENEYEQGKQRGKKFQTDYRNVKSTDAALSISYDNSNNNNNNNDSRGLNDAVPGSLKNDELAIEDDGAEVLIEMEKGNYNTNQGVKAGESDIRLSVAQNNHLSDINNNFSTPGRISTAEVIASVNDEGVDAPEEERPKIQLMSASISDHQGFAAGLNDVAAAENALEDDIIAHMATAGGDGNGGRDDDEKNDDAGRGNAGSIQLQYG